jgi:hypothetical protein
MNKSQNPTEQIFDDSIIAGVIEPFPEIDEIIPERAASGRVQFRVIGDVEGALQKLYQNQPVGSLDVLKSIKSTRQAIFSLKGNGYERNKQSIK